MRSSLNAPEIVGLARLSGQRVSGRVAAVPEPVARALIQQRLAAPDEYGGANITERGEQHLAELRRRGAVRRAERWAGRPKRGR